MGSGTYLRNAIKNYGSDAFTKEWLEFAEDADDLAYLERMYVNDEWLARPDTYNLILGGSAKFGFHHSEETRKKISAKAKERLKDKTKHPMYGKHCWTGDKNPMRRQDVKEKVVNAVRGRKLSGDTKKKISESRKRFCLTHPGSCDRNSGKYWFTDGHTSVLAFTQPNENWQRGRN